MPIELGIFFPCLFTEGDRQNPEAAQHMQTVARDECVKQSAIGPRLKRQAARIEPVELNTVHMIPVTEFLGRQVASVPHSY